MRPGAVHLSHAIIRALRWFRCRCLFGYNEGYWKHIIIKGERSRLPLSNHVHSLSIVCSYTRSFPDAVAFVKVRSRSLTPIGSKELRSFHLSKSKITVAGIT